MNSDSFRIRDHCRKNLISYTLKAFSFLPKSVRPLVLDMGCGTGEPTLALAGVGDGYFYAVDPDPSCGGKPTPRYFSFLCAKSQSRTCLSA